LYYKKLIILVLIVVIGLGFWYGRRQSEKNRYRRYDSLAHVYAETSVMAELYRNEPQLFYAARDSLYRLYDFNPESIMALRNSLANREEDYSYVWQVIKRKTDSLVEYYKAHPIEHTLPDSLDTIEDSVTSRH